MQPHCLEFRLMRATAASLELRFQCQNGSRCLAGSSFVHPECVAVPREAYRAQPQNNLKIKESSRSTRGSPPAEQVLVDVMEAVSNGQGCNAREHLSGM